MAALLHVAVVLRHRLTAYRSFGRLVLLLTYAFASPLKGFQRAYRERSPVMRE